MTDPSAFSPEQASDPGTSAQDMAAIAAERPDLWPALAANPSLYPDLRQWLGQIDDPAVKEALAASEHRAGSTGEERSAAEAAPVPPPPPPPPAGGPAGSVPPAPTAAGSPVPPPPPGSPAGSVPLAPTAAGSPVPPPPVAPARGTRRRRPRAWGIEAAVLAVVLVLGGGAYAVYAHFFQRGASSPEAAMDYVSQAVQDKDVITLFKMVSPAEIDTVSDSAEAVRKNDGDTGKSSKADPDKLISKDALDSYLEAINVTSSEMDYSIDRKSDDLAIATVSSWNLKANVDQSLATTLRTRYESAKGEPLNGDEEDFFDDLDFSDASYNGDVADSFSEDIPLELVMVQEEGRWYVSPTMTVAQWSYRDRARYDDDVKAPSYNAEFTSAKGAATAEDAVENLTESVLDARRPSDLLDDDVVGMLSLPERRLAMVYGPTMIGEDHEFSERASESMQVDWKLTSTSIGSGKAVVRPGHSTVTLNPNDSDRKVTLAFDDDTVDVTTSASENNTASVDFTRQLANPDHLGVVAEKSDGTWHVSYSGTIVNIFSLRPSQGALDKLANTLTDWGMDSDDADDLAEEVTQSAAIATPVLVVADVAQQLKDLDWENDSYSSDPPSRSSSGSSNSSLRSSCSAGNMADCDSLFYSSPYGSDDESFGKSCGGRSPSMRSGGDCKSTYGTRH